MPGPPETPEEVLMKKLTIIALALGIAVAAFTLMPTEQASADVAASHHGHGQVHWVRYGETLYSIGRLYNRSPQCLAHANGLVNPNFIRAGQRLVIPARCGPYPGPIPPHPAPPHPMPPHHPTCHTVQWGQTLWGISTMYGMSPWCVARANGLANPNFIRAGQCLAMPHFCRAW